MRSRNLIILAAVVVVVAGFIFFIERHQPTTDEVAEKADRIFPGLDVDAVVAVEIESSRGPVRLTLVDDVWHLVEPLDWEAEKSAVRSLISALANLDSERRLPFGDVDLVDYGLDDPALEVVLLDSDGRRFTLAVGDAMPFGSNRAVRRDEDEEIHLSPEAFVAALDREIDDWRSRDVIDLLEHDLGSIDVETPEDRIVITKDDGRWQLREPLADLADGDQIRSLVSELNALRISEFLPTDGEPLDFDAHEAGFRVVLTRVGGEEAVTLELTAAEEGEGAGTVICRRNGEDVFVVSDSIATRLSKAPVLWRSDKVWPFSSWDAATVEIAAGSEEITVRETDGLWRFEDGREADTTEIRRRLNALADLVVREHDLVLPPTEVMGSVILVLDNDRGAEGLTYTFYAPMEEGGHAAVTVSSRANVMGVDAVTVESILGDLENLHPAVVSSPAEE